MVVLDPFPSSKCSWFLVHFLNVHNGFLGGGEFLDTSSLEVKVYLPDRAALSPVYLEVQINHLEL